MVLSIISNLKIRLFGVFFLYSKKERVHSMNFKVVIGLAGGFLSYYLGGWDIMLQVLVTLTVVDYLTGLLAGAYEGKLSSKVGYKGIIKKVSMFLIIVLATCLDMVLENELVKNFTELSSFTLVRNVTIVFYIGNEGLSILENVMRTGLKIPDKLKKILNSLLENKNDKGDDKDV